MTLATSQFVLQKVLNTLPKFRYRYANEMQLHEGLALALAEGGISFEREHIAGPADRFDFLCGAGVVIEAKIKGSMSEAARQIERYCKLDCVHAIVIVAPKDWGPLRSDVKFNGKPVRFVRIEAQAF